MGAAEFVCDIVLVHWRLGQICTIWAMRDGTLGSVFMPI